MKINRRSLSFTLALAAIGAICHADSVQLPVQGLLATQDGTPITVPTSVGFDVFQGGFSGTIGSGVKVYSEAGTVTPGPTGGFSYNLGSGVPNGSFLIVNGIAQPNVLSTATFNANQIYLELTVGGNVLSPRIWMAPVSSSLYSIMARNLLGDAHITSTDTTKPSLTTSSSVIVLGGYVQAPIFIGSGALLTGVNASSIPAAGVNPGLLGPGVLLNSANLIGGPLPAGILPSTAAFTSVANIFTAPQTISGGGGNVPGLHTSTGIVSDAGITGAYFFGQHIGDGSKLTGVVAASVPASGIFNGPLAQNLLPNTVAFTNAANTYTAAQVINGQDASAVSLRVSGGINAAGGTITAASYAGNGAALTGINAANVPAAGITVGTIVSGVNIPAANLVSGPIASSMLPATVAYTNAANSFSAAQSAPSFTGAHIGDGSGLTNVPQSVRYVSGSSPACATGSVLIKNWASTSGTGSAVCGGGSCTTPAGWNFNAPACGILLWQASGCYTYLVTATAWTSVVCVGP